MKKLLIKIVLLAGISLVPVYFLCVKYTKGYIDEFYQRFTAQRATNLVLGSSRSAQAFNPDVLFGKAGGLNFSFTLSVSPYGKVYLEAIKKMTDDLPGTVIMEVNPIQFSEDTMYLEKENKYRENSLMLGKMHLYGFDPNFEYLFTCMKSPLYALMANKSRFLSKLKLHANGWLQVYPSTQSNYEVNLNKNIGLFKGYFKKMAIARKRLEAFQHTIEYLKEHHKKVYLVRLPVCDQLFGLENRYWPDFDRTMLNIAGQYRVEYLNEVKDTSYKTHDGSHLESRSALRLSEWMNQYINE